MTPPLFADHSLRSPGGSPHTGGGQREVPSLLSLEPRGESPHVGTGMAAGQVVAHTVRTFQDFCIVTILFCRTSRGFSQSH